MSNKFDLPGVHSPEIGELDDDNPPQEDSTTPIEIIGEKPTSEFFQDVGSMLPAGSKIISLETMRNGDVFAEYQSPAGIVSREKVLDNEGRSNKICFTDASGAIHEKEFDGNGGVKEEIHRPSLTEGSMKRNNSTWQSGEYHEYHSERPQRPPPPPMPPCKPPRKTETGAAAKEEAVHAMQVYENLRQEAHDLAYADAQEAYDKAIKIEIDKLTGITTEFIGHEFSIDPSAMGSALRLAFKLNGETKTLKFTEEDMLGFKRIEEVSMPEMAEAIVRELSVSIAQELTIALFEDAKTSDVRYSKLNPVMFKPRFTTSTGPR